MLRVLKQAFKTGVLTNKFPAVRTEPPVGVQGKPVINFAQCTIGDACADACPTGALAFEKRQRDPGTGKMTAELTLDYGKCIYCGECMRAAPECISIAPELPSATTNKTDLASRARYRVGKNKNWEYVE
jgi:formate hydrogenlyase subunit 6/NADH:ubiquinone oxidoreductase subunit I